MSLLAAALTFLLVPGAWYVVAGAAAGLLVSSRPADLLSLAITLLAASRLPVLPTILIGVGSAGLLRHLLG